MVVAHGPQNRFDGRIVLRFACKRAIQIHQMQTSRAFGDPIERHLCGVFAEGCSLVHVALDEAHTMSVFKVNGWDEKHDGGWSSRVPVDEITVQG